RGELIAQRVGLRAHRVAIAITDAPDWNAGVHGPRLESKIRRDEAERPDHCPFGNAVRWHHDSVRSGSRIVLEDDVAGNEAQLQRTNVLGHDRDEIIGEVVARTPDLDAGRQAAEIAERE